MLRHRRGRRQPRPATLGWRPSSSTSPPTPGPTPSSSRAPRARTSTSSRTPAVRVPQRRPLAAGAARRDRPPARIGDPSSPSKRPGAVLSTSSRARSTARRSTSWPSSAPPAIKIAAFEIINLGLIRYAAAVGATPMIIWCRGIVTYGEIKALGAVAETGNRAVALLRCASVYPAPPEIMNLRAMATMRAAFGVPVGLSDHTTTSTWPPALEALGMDVFEKHFTLSRELEGTDHALAGSSPTSSKRRSPPCARSRRPWATDAWRSHRGARVGRDVPQRAPVDRRGRRHRRGHRDHRRHARDGQRPGFGIAPKYLELVVGRAAKIDIPYDEIVTWEMV